MIIIFVTMQMIDTTERDRALKDLERERELRRQSELEAAQSRLHYQQVANQVRLLQEEIDRLRAELNILRSVHAGPHNVRVKFEDRIVKDLFFIESLWALMLIKYFMCLI